MNSFEQLNFEFVKVFITKMCLTVEIKMYIIFTSI